MTQRVEFEGIPAIMATPASGSGPGVIVIQEWWGLVPHIHEVCDRLAAAGFTALAVDHYRGALTSEPDEAQKHMLGLEVARAATDFSVAARFLVGNEACSTASIGAVGFCMGGGLALLAPTVAPEIAITSAFYPAMPWPDYAPNWSNYAGRRALVHKAASDEEWAGPRVAEYVAAIQAAGGHADVYEYADSVHAFFNDARPEVYQADHAALAWERTVEAFRSLR
jgi:carboxymethylenebutenolidase